MADVRTFGYTQMPSATGHTVTVPGAVMGWHDLLTRHRRMTLRRSAATGHPHGDGYPVAELAATMWQAGVP
ncbi:MAG: hypothetical protein R2911_43090 [Caldilineaceae bacterium]